MDNDVAELGLTMVLGLVFASVVAWCVLIARSSTSTLFRYDPHRSVPWGLIDLGLAMVVIIASGAAASVLLIEVGIVAPGQQLADMPADSLKIAVLASSVSMFLGLIASLGLIWLKNRPTLGDFGISGQSLLRQTWVGIAVFFLVAAPVYAIQFCVVEVFELRYEHPLIELVKQDPSPSTITIAFIVAVALAPLTEEFLIRVLLQGWLERIPGHRGATSTLLLGGADASGGAALTSPPIWPVVVSSVLFALLHISHGAGVIPLFVLAFGLGFVYRQTHRVLPCIVIHMLFNGFSLALLLVDVYGGST